MTYMGYCKEAKSQLADFFDIISVFVKQILWMAKINFVWTRIGVKYEIGTIAILFELSNPVLATTNHESNVLKVLRDGLTWLIFCLIKF